MKVKMAFLAVTAAIGIVAPKPVYMICDVEEYHSTDTGTAIYVEMPTGDVEIYEVEDAPEDITEVCMMTLNQDNYESYEVVAIR